MACAASNILGGLTTSRHIDPNYAIPCQKYCKNIWRWQLWKHFLSAISSWQDSTFNGPTINVTYTPLLTDWSELTSLLVFTAQLNSMGIQFPNETPFICAYTENCTISKSCVTNILDGLKTQTYRPILCNTHPNHCKTFNCEIREKSFLSWEDSILNGHIISAIIHMLHVQLELNIELVRTICIILF